MALSIAGSSGRRLPARRAPPATPSTHVGEHGVEGDGHDRDVDGERQQRPAVLAEDELRAGCIGLDSTP